MFTLEWYLMGVGTMVAVYFTCWLFGFNLVRRDLAMIPFFSAFGPFAFVAAMAYGTLTVDGEYDVVFHGRVRKRKEKDQ